MAVVKVGIGDVLFMMVHSSDHVHAWEGSQKSSEGYCFTDLIKFQLETQWAFKQYLTKTDKFDYRN